MNESRSSYERTKPSKKPKKVGPRKQEDCRPEKYKSDEYRLPIKDCSQECPYFELCINEREEENYRVKQEEGEISLKCALGSGNGN